jgi:hypothetical protein
VIHLAKLLQLLGMLILVQALYIGLRFNDRHTELYLLLGGIVVFSVGTWINPNRRR